MRSSRPGSTWSSGPWTCARPGCRARCRSCASAPTSTYCRNATAATCPPAPGELTRASLRQAASRRPRPAAIPDPTDPTTPDPTAPDPTDPTTPDPTAPDPTDPTAPDPTDPTDPAGPAARGGPGRNGPGRPGRAPAAGPSLAALVTITIPYDTYQGRSEAPGEADGFGPLDGDDARDLAAAAARHPRTRWCITAVNPDGTAAAHGCLPGRHPPPGTGPPGRPPALAAPLIPVARGPCDHARAEIGYHPSRALAST